MGAIKSALLDSYNIQHNFCGLQDNLSKEIMRPQQVHGTDVLIWREDSKIQPADAVVTNLTSAPIGVSVADCLPILAATKDGKYVGACHAGWRGLAQNIVLSFVKTLCKQSGKISNDLIVAIGPSICSKHFVVQDDVIAAFKKSFALNEKNLKACFHPFEDRWTVDLQKLCFLQLKEIGVAEVDDLKICTFENQDWASFRRDKKIPKSNIAWISAV